MSGNVVVIGGGASGLAAAEAAARAGADVILLERLERVGKKLLLTGNGRCNLGHEGEISGHYHGLVAPEAVLRGFDTAAYFARLGLWTRTDEQGRMYPRSGLAASVLDALRFAVTRAGCGIRTGKKVTAIEPHGNGFRVRAGQESFDAAAVIVAAGGCAAPGCGTDGSLFEILRDLGHEITPLYPALAPVLTPAELVRAMKGVRARAAVSAIKDGRILRTECGEVQFTERALSGICVFALSRLASVYRGELTLSLDLAREFSHRELYQMLLQLRETRGDLPGGDFLTGLVPKRVGECLIKRLFGGFSAPAGEILRGTCDVELLAKTLKDWRFPVLGTAGFSSAQVTAGGVSSASVKENLESAVSDRLFFCGEVLDIDGDCGGYNLMWSWASGALAGENAARAVLK